MPRTTNWRKDIPLAFDGDNFKNFILSFAVFPLNPPIRRNIISPSPIFFSVYVGIFKGFMSLWNVCAGQREDWNSMALFMDNNQKTLHVCILLCKKMHDLYSSPKEIIQISKRFPKLRYTCFYVFLLRISYTLISYFLLKV